MSTRITVGPTEDSCCNDQGSRTRKFEQIIGNSPALEAVLEGVKRVAPTSSTVSESKAKQARVRELIARAIHNISPRCGRPFVKLNCAAIPLDLLESELFGHEKGAFTGAIAQKLGRFRVGRTKTHTLSGRSRRYSALLLQQPNCCVYCRNREFERLGSSQTHHVDVRLVACDPSQPRVRW